MLLDILKLEITDVVLKSLEKKYMFPVQILPQFLDTFYFTSRKM